jgi:glycosyltransferase involved in cell wall biosynthesis
MEKITLVIPCFRGETTLNELVAEIIPLTTKRRTNDGHEWLVEDVVLVYDGGGEGLRRTIQKLADKNTFIRPVWLSRNFGQHAATFAGLAHSKGSWVVTVDEDGQHNPRDIETLLDRALYSKKPLVYARPTNSPRHGWLRNLASRSAKKIASRLLGGPEASLFQSFRLIEGNLARSVASKVGPNVYFDIAFSWFVDTPATAEVTLRRGSDRTSGYSFPKLLRHFWILFLSIGTRTMRGITFIGLAAAISGSALAIFFIVQRFLGSDFPAGWASQITVSLVSGGLILLSLGLIAEYLGSAVNKLMGQPTFFALTTPDKEKIQREPS